MIKIGLQFFGGNGAESGKSGASFKEIDDDSVFDKSVDKWRSNMTDEEYDYTRQYTSWHYEEINDSIRSNIDDPSSWDPRTSEIDSALSKFQLTENIVTYRGLGMGAIDAMIPGANTMSLSELNSAFSGAIISDPAFLSTSITQSVAQDFASSHNYILKINVPKGKGRGAYVHSISSHPNENEFLMPRNTKLKITKVTRAPGDWGDTVTLFHVDIV